MASIAPQTHPNRYYGTFGSSASWLTGSFTQKYRQILVICKDTKGAETAHGDLQFFLGAHVVHKIPSWDSIPFELVSPSREVIAERIASLGALMSGQEGVFITSAESLLSRIISRQFIERHSFEISTHNPLPRESLIQLAETAGYRRVSLVEHRGDFAVRGFVIDIFPSNNATPWRIEYSGKNLSSIRAFDPETQRTNSSAECIQVLPAKEWVSFRRELTTPLERDAAVAKVKQIGQDREVPLREIAKVIHDLDQGVEFNGIEVLAPFMSGYHESILDFLSEQGLVVLYDEIAVHQALEKSWETLRERAERVANEHTITPLLEDSFFEPTEILSKLSHRHLIVVDSLADILSSDDDSGAAPSTVNIRSLPLPHLRSTTLSHAEKALPRGPLKEILHRWRNTGYRIAFAVGSLPRAERLSKMLLELDIDAPVSQLTGHGWEHHPAPQAVSVLLGHLSSSFMLPNELIVFIAEHDIFAERSYRRKPVGERTLKRLMNSLSQLTEGDYVVHIDYGIGIYRGLKHLNIEGQEGDFLHIDYAGDSRLYLPVQNIAKVQKFSAADGEVPVVDRLGSNRWAKTKESVRESVQTLAGDLIKLYATRSVAKGWRFDSAGALDEKFAEDFPFDETPDQLAAINDTIRDMASEKPMDRLVCGDAGFGKTEVALRAAYKAVQHRKQVAVLVPTTILAEQHYQNFSRRLAEYDTRVAVLSRLHSTADNKEVLAKVASGEIDVVIGTHRLLQRDTAFFDLGLVVIDEEHRFGVKQKERLKQLKRQVDVLTLTATPIPRTLHMALLGIRDVSVISTPPVDRRLIRTYVASYAESIVRDAIIREVARGGQCFFLHNRIESIGMVTTELMKLVPEARFDFAHGQMNEGQLESIMKRFVSGEIDVLVSTTIVESGLDIPNANTIILDRADTYGLAQLYQLRGRVGRSTKQAYAYFLVPKTAKLGSDAQKRLKAIQSLDELGMGFNLALRDMEIRGTGNLLGKEQSGMVLAVGFDLYTKILKEAIMGLKGEELDLTESIDPEVKVPLPCFIPEFYVPDISERLVLYQRLAGIASEQDVDDLRAELNDRFGPPPIEAENYMHLMRVRSLLRIHGVSEAEATPYRITLSISSRAPLDRDKVLGLVQRHPHSYRLGKNSTITITHSKSTYTSPREVFSIIESFLEVVSSRTGGENLPQTAHASSLPTRSGVINT